MSHVTDKPQKVSGMLLLSNHESNVHHHRAMREVKANTIMLTCTKFNTTVKLKEMPLWIQKCFRNMRETTKHFCNKIFLFLFCLEKFILS